MQIRCGHRSEQGSMLLIAVCTAVILGGTLGSYLWLVRSQYASVVRSQAWHSALAMAEAGVEEALAQMNRPGDDLTANGWGGPDANGFFGPVMRTATPGSYSVAIITNPTPVIFSTGYVAMAGTEITLSRVVKVNVKRLPLINAAFAARYNIYMNGNGLASNSFNSRDPAWSTNGKYDPNKTRTNGSAASVQGLVDIGNHTVGGNLYLGPGASYNGTVGQVLGKIFYDFNVDYPDAQLPNTLWYAAPWEMITVSGKTRKYYHFTVSGDYTVSDSTPILVDPNITVRLKVTDNDFDPGDIHILGGEHDSGTLIVYHVAGTASMAGNVNVDSMRAENFWYFGLPGVTSVTFGGNSQNVGVIYAPSAHLTLNGGGGNYGLIGASITKTITMNGHYNFHYDEALGIFGPTRGYIPTSWEEL